MRPSILFSALIGVGSARAAAVQLPFSRSSAPASSGSPATFFQQPGSSSPLDWPYRELEWGDINVLHTTDTHGWLLGHQRQEASFSGDWGDLYSFVTKMKAEARRRGVDLLVVDSGDRVDGNGLVDGEPEGHVKGWTAMKFFAEMSYDVVTTGNHELYKYPTALSTYDNISRRYGSRYVTSNVNITLPAEPGHPPKDVPLGHRFAKFRTEQGRNVTALGPLFFFKAHARGTTVQKPSEMIKERWFLDAITDKPDVFLLVGHMSIQQGDSEWTEIFNAIRAVHPTTPILIFGGHHHIRDCVQEDARSMSLASGRYMETIGWMSVKGIDEEPSLPLEFSRRYLDQNRNTYMYHAGADFDTAKGIEITQSMDVVANSDAFNLTYQFGVAPHSFYLSRYPPTAEQSMFNLMVSLVLPLLVNRLDRPNAHMTILNTGSIRFDIFKGPFTRNDQWIILPFTNNFEFVRNVPRSVAAQLLAYLNFVGEHGLLPSSLLDPTHSVEHIYRRTQLESFNAYRGRTDLTWGYVTLDSCPGLGDDTLHKPLPSVAQPVFVATELPEGEEEDLVDVAFFDFIEPDVLSALNVLQDDRVFTSKDVGLFVTNLTANTLMQEYALRKWH